MDISERFNEIKHEGNMLRIDPNHPLNLFIGLDQNRNRVFILKSKKRLKKTKSTKALDISLLEMEGHSQLSIRLNNIQLKDIFLKFIQDIYDFTNLQSNEVDLINKYYSRVYLWKSTFSNPNRKILSNSSIRGLMGELLFLKSHMLNRFGLIDSLNAWVGPKKYKRDFETKDTWFEVKTKSSNSYTVKITSISQLDVEVNGFLAVVSLDATEIINDKTYNLNSLILEIFSIYDDLELLDSLQNRLDEIGYSYDPDYDDINFIIMNIDIYTINEQTQILRKKDLPNSVTDVTYRLDINHLMKIRG